MTNMWHITVLTNKNSAAELGKERRFRQLITYAPISAFFISCICRVCMVFFCIEKKRKNTKLDFGYFYETIHLDWSKFPLRWKSSENDRLNGGNEYVVLGALNLAFVFRVDEASSLVARSLVNMGRGKCIPYLYAMSRKSK